MVPPLAVLVIYVSQTQNEDTIQKSFIIECILELSSSDNILSR